MSFGIKTAPSLFQKAMIRVFASILSSALVYIDDILLFSLDIESHAVLLQIFYSLVQTHGIMLSKEKMFLAQPEIDFLGMYISKGMAEKRFYYVVFVGKVPGIYESWIAYSEQVTRFFGAVFKKYLSLEEANNAWTVYVEAHSNVQLLSPQLAQLSTDYPPLLIPVQANMDDQTHSNLPKHCVYIAMLTVGANEKSSLAG
ncbi:uncharacterized protein LOC131321216 [Rhododendron vialii]|uniref:uncharacterized protein LOC131321216 n=1 Tax=Rhododendron vialii TaxID=182163 RepID=UPI00265DC50A|nr:uncharacterized protein LOC131321216 [Rhododendron vialii]